MNRILIALGIAAVIAAAAFFLGQCRVSGLDAQLAVANKEVADLRDSAEDAKAETSRARKQADDATHEAAKERAKSDHLSKELESLRDKNARSQQASSRRIQQSEARLEQARAEAEEAKARIPELGQDELAAKIEAELVKRYEPFAQFMAFGDGYQANRPAADAVFRLSLDYGKALTEIAELEAQAEEAEKAFKGCDGLRIGCDKALEASERARQRAEDALRLRQAEIAAIEKQLGVSGAQRDAYLRQLKIKARKQFWERAGCMASVGGAFGAGFAAGRLSN